MKRLSFLTVLLLSGIILISTGCANKTERLARDYFDIIEDCFSQYDLEQYEKGEVSVYSVKLCIMKDEEFINKIVPATNNMTDEEGKIFKKEVKRLMRKSKYGKYMMELY